MLWSAFSRQRRVKKPVQDRTSATCFPALLLPRSVTLMLLLSVRASHPTLADTCVLCLRHVVARVNSSRFAALLSNKGRMRPHFTIVTRLVALILLSHSCIRRFYFFSVFLLLFVNSCEPSRCEQLTISAELLSRLVRNQPTEMEQWDAWWCTCCVRPVHLAV